MRSSFLIAFSAIVAAGLLAACTIVESDEPLDNGEGGSGGTAGSSTGGSAQGGAAQGGSAQGGAAQGGAAGEAGAAQGGAAGEAGAAGAAGAAGSGDQDKKVGEGCYDDSYCLPGLKCILPSGTEFFGGGPGNGYCTVSCTTDANACAGFAGTTCVDLSVTTEISAWCLATCATGSETDKCFNRIDVACSNLGPLTEGGADVVACVPVCANDSDCGDGLVCDKKLNVCVTQASAGTGALGTTCDPANDTCQGKCLTQIDANNNEISVCSQRCVYGHDGACGQDISTGLESGVCLYGAIGGEEIGDEAFCAKFCDKNEDCATGLICDLSFPVHNHGYCRAP